MIRFFIGFIGSIFANGVIALGVGGLILVTFFWHYADDLPSHRELAQYEPQIISRIYSSEGNLIDEFARERRLFIPYADIPELVKQAFISAEDKNFYRHTGFDPVGIASAVFEAARGGRLRGASTITQQVVKNFLLSSERSASRKIKELILATRIEQILSKEDILELYLNEIFLGQNSYGIAAAAQSYFNKAVEELSLNQAAYIAGLPKAPSRYHPTRNYDQAIARRNFVLREMFENGFIDQASYEKTRAEDLETVQSGQIVSFRKLLPPRNYFTDEINRRLSAKFGSDTFFTQGLSVRSTLDQGLQREAEIALRSGLESYDRAQGIWRKPKHRIEAELLESAEKWRPALRAVEMPRDIEGWYLAVVLSEQKDRVRIGIEGISEVEKGHFIPKEDVGWARPIRAGGKIGKGAKSPRDLVSKGDVVYVKALFEKGAFLRWSLRQIPEVQGGFMAMDVNTGRVLAMQGGFSYEGSVFNRVTQAKRQPGSAFKPFVYAAALDSGFTPATIAIDAPIEIETVAGLWQPSNASNKFYGPAPLRTGIERSRNLMTVRVAQEIGLDIIANYAERFGLYEHMNPFLSNALGAQETTLFKIVSAYAMFANGGERVQPTLVDRIQDRRGNTIFRHDTRVCENCRDMHLPAGRAPQITSDRFRIMDAVTAYQLTSMMQGVVERGTASRAIDLPVPIAGKTGTTNESRDAWFIGFSSTLAAGCYIGFDTPKTLGKRASGGRLCAPIFNAFMKKAITLYGGGPFKVPEGGIFVKMDRYSGAPVPEDSEGPHVVAELFRKGTEPRLGIISIIDGGWEMGADVPTFVEGEAPIIEAPQKIVTSTGRISTLGKKATFGEISSGGLY